MPILPGSSKKEKSNKKNKSGVSLEGHLYSTLSPCIADS
jgi:hypothetical protein